MLKLGFVVTFTLAMLGSATSAQAQWYWFPKKVVIDQQKVRTKDICGAQYGKLGCRTTKFGLTLTEADIPIDVKNGEPEWRAVLGQMVQKNDYRGTLDSLIPCSSDGLIKFDDSNLASLGTKTIFSFKKTADVRSYANLGIDLEQLLLQSGVPTENVGDLEARFKTSYDKVAAKKWEMKGNYYRVKLNTDTFTQIRSNAATNAASKECGDRIRTLKNAGFELFPIYSISVIELDSAGYSSGIAERFAAEFAARVRKTEKDADIASIEAGITSAVQTAFQASTGSQIRVIAWDYMSMPTSFDIPLDAIGQSAPSD